ncbi:MAG: DUF1704 domain-containing protein [Nanoarchaeota archaeon]|nr:DUF1704 domain-containing protein [Nanoarchaeota archaeon]MBU1321971.1 DUF1704 domain-containing protein [Nanoarchaeota archaeon]MBU1598305.1 DUF1704 domain-containing protein [Nanoarchaeota archaeon]MBU2441797.1 DUF1704 domain-containing protein [Nanoarchaeota archaeon]
MRLSKKIIELDNYIDQASRNLHLKILNPTNLAKIRRDFFAKKIKNPVFEYELPSNDLLELKRQISAIQLPAKGILNKIMIEKQRDILNKIDLIYSIGCSDFTEKSINVYGVPDKKLVNRSYDILNQPYEKEKRKKVLSKDAVRLLKINLQTFGLEYKIKKEDIVTSCSIRSPQGLIVLKRKQRFSADFLNRLIVHEIGTHAFRYENGLQQDLKVFRHGLIDYLPTEEGLAVYNEECFGLLKQVFLRNYAGRIIGVHFALQNDFITTYRELKKFFDPKKAFQLTARIKRGLLDTSLPGGHTKDIVYLQGYFEVKDYVKNGGKIEDLYYGKITWKDVDKVKKLGLKPPKILPVKFELFEDYEKVKNEN